MFFWGSIFLPQVPLCSEWRQFFPQWDSKKECGCLHLCRANFYRKILESAFPGNESCARTTVGRSPVTLILFLTIYLKTWHLAKIYCLFIFNLYKATTYLCLDLFIYLYILIYLYIYWFIYFTFFHCVLLAVESISSSEYRPLPNFKGVELTLKCECPATL